MKNLTRTTWIKVVLIIALCLLLCISFAVGTTSCTNRTLTDLGDHGDAGGQVFSVPDAPTVSDTSDAPSPPVSMPANVASGTRISSTSYSLDEARGIDINWAAGSVTVQVVDDKDTDGAILVEEYRTGNPGRMSAMRTSSEGGRLTIDYGDVAHGIVGCSTLGSKHLVMRIPASAASTLENFALNCASGSCSLYGITCGALELNMASGTLDAQNMQANRLVLDVASGKGNVSGQFASSMELNVASGDVRIANSATSCNAADISLMSGTLDVNLSPDASFMASVDKLSGNFDCNFAEATQHGEQYEYRATRASEDTSCTISASIASGHLTLAPIG